MGIAACVMFFISLLVDWTPLLLIAIALLIAAAVAGAKAANQPAAPMHVSTSPVSDQVRQQSLQEFISTYIASTRGRVETVTPYSAVVVTGQKVNHVLHLLVSVLLCGFWLPIWLIVALTGGEKRHVLNVDKCGNVSRS